MAAKVLVVIVSVSFTMMAYKGISNGATSLQNSAVMAANKVSLEDWQKICNTSVQGDAVRYYVKKYSSSDSTYPNIYLEVLKKDGQQKIASISEIAVGEELYVDPSAIFYVVWHVADDETVDGITFIEKGGG